jgi:ABC-type thiamin/hydroxymethylpyrimidine transport system permease subunit
MSLKGFHIIFIVLAVLCAFGFYGWTVYEPVIASRMGVDGLGTTSGLIGASLLIYGVWFVAKKYKTIIV